MPTRQIKTASITAVSHLDSAKPEVPSQQAALLESKKVKVKTRGVPSARLPENTPPQSVPACPRALYASFIKTHFVSPQGLRPNFFNDVALPSAHTPLASKQQKTIDDLFDGCKNVTVTHAQVVALWKAIGGTSSKSGGSHQVLVNFAGKKSRFFVPHGAGSDGYGPKFSKFLQAALLREGVLPTKWQEEWKKLQCVPGDMPPLAKDCS